MRIELEVEEAERCLNDALRRIEALTRERDEAREQARLANVDWEITSRELEEARDVAKWLLYDSGAYIDDHWDLKKKYRWLKEG